MASNSSKRKKPHKSLITIGSTFNYDGVDYKVNAKGRGIYKRIIKKIIEQLTIARAIHKRLLVIRFDLRSSNFKRGNEEISRFRKCIVQWIERNYQAYSIGTTWAREQKTSEYQHYHFALWIDGDKIRRSDKLKMIIQDKWIEEDPCNHSPHNCDNGTYFIDDDNVFKDVVYRLSYLAKVYTKGHQPKHHNNYSTSRLKAKE